MIPHINGSPNDMKHILEIAHRHSISVVEDSCDALGSKFSGKFVGTFGDLGCFSFYPTKVLGAYSDGGFVLTKVKYKTIELDFDDEELLKYMVFAHEQGITFNELCERAFNELCERAVKEKIGKENK